jgi:hypothetical protein
VEVEEQQVLQDHHLFLHLIMQEQEIVHQLVLHKETQEVLEQVNQIILELEVVVEQEEQVLLEETQLEDQVEQDQQTVFQEVQ